MIFELVYILVSFAIMHLCSSLMWIEILLCDTNYYTVFHSLTYINILWDPFSVFHWLDKSFPHCVSVFNYIIVQKTVKGIMYIHNKIKVEMNGKKWKHYIVYLIIDSHDTFLEVGRWHLGQLCCYWCINRQTGRSSIQSARTSTLFLVLLCQSLHHNT